MKHLLIILSILLLSSPVIGLDLKETLPVSGGKGVTLYEWETSSGGKIWKYFGDNKIHTKYKGEVKKGLPNGLGIKIYSIRESVKIKFKSKYGRQFLIKYIGSFKNGKEWNGKGYNMHEDFIVEYVNGKLIPQ